MSRGAQGWLVLLVGIPLSILLGGVMLEHLWRWFLVPPFGAPDLTVSEAIGVSTLWGFLSIRTSSKRSDGADERGPLEVFAVSTFTSLFVYGIAYLTHLVIR